MTGSGQRRAPQAAEGVIQFQAVHVWRSLGEEGVAAAALLNGWRSRLWRMGVIGQRADRYGGVGYGNVSARAHAAEGFWVSGTQTGASARLDGEQLCAVRRWRVDENRVWSEGATLPSSESMTHGVLYDMDAAVGSVLHIHCAPLWRAGQALGLVVTDPDVGYGTPQMAAEARRVWASALDTGVIIMGGHEDGVLAFGRTPDEAGARLLAALSAAQTP